MEISQLQSIGDDELHDFLNNAPKYFREGERIKKFQLKNGDYIHCVLWNYHFYITGTDIVKILVWRFQNSGRQLGNMKKFEEGIFSDLRNLKPGIDASLEGPRSEFLEFLYKNGCIRTQKKQKVFYWYSVPHDALFCDALERDLRRDNSMYSYNGYPTDRRASYSDIITNPKNMGYQKMPAPLFNNIFEAPRKIEPVCELKNNHFNIKSSLFGDINTMNSNSASCQIESPIRNEAQNSYSFDKIFSMGAEAKLPRFEDYENESKLSMIKSKVEADFKRKFDDFDLDQLDFLKERCQEHFGFGQGSCEKKKISANPQTKDSGMGTSAKVSFIGMNNSEINQ